MKVKVPHVSNLASPRTGDPVPNQFVIRTEEGTFFQSYSTIIAFQPNMGPTKLNRSMYDYSVTTSKYRNQFLGMTSAEVKKAIKKGTIELVDFESL